MELGAPVDELGRNAGHGPAHDELAAVVDLDPLRHARGARRVDHQAGLVVREVAKAQVEGRVLLGLPGGDELAEGTQPRLGVAEGPEAHEVGQTLDASLAFGLEQLLEEGDVAHGGDAGPGVSGDVRGLFDRGVPVDRRGHTPGELDTGLELHPRGRVGTRHHDAFAHLVTEGDERFGHVAGTLVVVPPAERVPAPARLSVQGGLGRARFGPVGQPVHERGEVVGVRYGRRCRGACRLRATMPGPTTARGCRPRALAELRAVTEACVRAPEASRSARSDAAHR